MGLAGREFYPSGHDDEAKMIIRRESGFSLVELIITMVIFVMVIAAISNIFVGLLGQFKQQSKIAESNIEGIVGLQMLKTDIEQAGFGLPFDVNGAIYTEAVNDATTAFDDTAFNDAGTNPPRALLVGTNLTMPVGGANTSDALVVKGSTLAVNDASQKWAYITSTLAGYTITPWSGAAGVPLPNENLQNNDRVIALDPRNDYRLTYPAAGTFYTLFNSNPASASWNGYASQPNDGQTYLIYGLSGNENPRMPFNRADYYVRTPGTMPTHCAAGTGILYKGTVNHGNGQHTAYPLLDCVASMKVVLATDSNADGVTDNYMQTWPAGTTAADIRAQLKEIRVYVLLHEGQRDPSFTYTAQGADLLLGVDHIGVRDPDWGLLLDYQVPDRSYRWKIYTMVITPYNLR